MQFSKKRTMGRMNAVLAAAAVIWGLMPGVASAVVITVPGDHPTIQGAIGAAAVSGDEIIVAPGTYPEVINFNGKAINLHSASGIPTDTIIDGTGLNDSVVRCVSGEGEFTILEGFTITGGDAINGGGGMFNSGSSPTVTNCIFSGNNAGCGGGMFNFFSSNPTVTNCTFDGNTADFGGGMENNTSSPTVIDCIFNNGNTAIDGGGMDNFNNSSPTVTNCTFNGNTATDNGGGMANFNNSSPIITDCIFDGNTATLLGGGMANFSNSSPIITSCTFSGNLATTTTTSGGGGMANFIFSSPIITSCTFSGNTATMHGGGMYNDTISSPTMTDCFFFENSATSGGGMYNQFSSPTVAECTFSGNTSTLHGGGMFNDGSSPTVTYCTFSVNTTTLFGGGMYNGFNSNPTVANCIFSGNTAAGAGGMYNIGNNPTVTDCIFSENTGTHAGGGGMVNVLGSSAIVTNCTFSQNHATHTDFGKGGGIFNNQSNSSITNCTFSGNSGNIGGGMYNVDNSSPTVINCTFSGNSAVKNGGGMFNQLHSSPSVTNCTFSRNTAGFDGGGMYNILNSSPTVINCILWDDSPDEIFIQLNSTPIISFSDVQGGFVGTGNINFDPLFVDAAGLDTIPGTADDDLRLLPGSPCLDAGSNAAPGLIGITTDLGGLSRILFTTVDMGAYERQTSPPSADTDGDGLTDADEIALALGSGCPDPLNADSDGDGLLDGVDPLPCNAPPFADAVVEQLTDIGADAVVRLDASSSSDPENLALTYKWIVDGASVCNGPLASCQTIDVSMSYGEHTVVLRVTDPAEEYDEVTTTITLDPAELTVLEIDKVKVKFDHDPPEIEIKGKIGLPFGVNFNDVLPLATITLNVGGLSILDNETILLAPETNEPEEWEYRDETALLGIRKFDIDWKGARFKFKEEDLGIKLKSQIITTTETVLTFKYKMEDINGAFSMNIGDLATVNVDAAGGVTAVSVDAVSGVTTDVPFEVEEEGEEIVLTLPFGLNDTMVITLTGSITATINVVDHLKASIGRFRLKARFNGAAFPFGAATTTRQIDLLLMIGAQFYPGETTLGPDDLKVKSNQWKAKRGD